MTIVNTFNELIENGDICPFCKDGRNEIDIYVNPDNGNTRIISDYDVAIIGVDKKNNIYVWKSNDNHEKIEKAINKVFKIKLRHIYGNVSLLVDELDFNGFNFTSIEKIFKRLKVIFPIISIAEQSTAPFRMVYRY